jgi:hypothetical protein
MLRYAENWLQCNAQAAAVTIQTGKHKPKGQLRNSYETITCDEDVQTSRELYESLASQGYSLQYKCDHQHILAAESCTAQSDCSKGFATKH